MRPCVPQAWAARRHTTGKMAREPRARKSVARLACWCCLPLCLLVLAVGCKGTRKAVEHVDVSGRVLYNGKPLPGGQVTFVTADGFASTGIIDEKGNYTINAPAGDVRISVDNRMLDKPMRSSPIPKEAQGKGAGRPDEGDPTPVKGTYKEIPSKYYTPDTSGLTYKVTKGESTHDIEVKD